MIENVMDTLDLQEMKYRKVFVRFERDARTSSVNVLLDGTHLSWIRSFATTQDEFNADCEKYAASEKYKEDYNKFMGWN